MRILFGDSYDADVACEPNSEAALCKQALMGAVLASFRRVVEGVGARPLLVLVPSRFDVAPPAPLGRLLEAQDGYDPDALCDAYLRLAAQAQIPCVDLRAAFRSAGAAALFVREDFHWSDAGQALAARVVAERWRELGLPAW